MDNLKILPCSDCTVLTSHDLKGTTHSWTIFYRGKRGNPEWLQKNASETLLQELLLSVWSLRECSSCRILSMVCFLSWSSWSLVSLALAAVAPVSRPVWGPEAEWRRGLCWGGPTACGALDQHTSLERERLSAWRRLSGTALVYNGINNGKLEP